MHEIENARRGRENGVTLHFSRACAPYAVHLDLKTESAIREHGMNTGYGMNMKPKPAGRPCASRQNNGSKVQRFIMQ